MKKLTITGNIVCFRPRGGIGSEQLPQSSDSDDSITSHPGHHRQLVAGQTQLDGCGLPKVQISGPSSGSEPLSINGYVIFNYKIHCFDY